MQEITPTPRTRKRSAPQIGIDKLSPMPLHAQAKRSIQAQILRRQLKEGDLFPSEMELCRTLSLSRSTVFRAVNELANEGILYRKQGAGTYVGRIDKLSVFTESKTIVYTFSRFLSTSCINEFVWPIVYAFQKTAQDLGFTSALTTLDESEESTNHFFENIGAGLYSGVVLFMQDAPLITRLHEYKIPAINVAPNPPGIPISSVYNDNVIGSRMGLEYLYKKKFKRIGIIASMAGNYSGQERYLACKEHPQLSEFEKVQQIRLESFDKEYRKKTIANFLAANPDLDAVFALHDSFAIDTMGILWSRGIKIPDEMAVMGYDDTISASQMYPPLTTIGVDKESIGDSAAKLLTNQMLDQLPNYITCRIPPKLVIRQSA